MSNKRVSIVVPIYNVEQYLEKLIVSLIDQSYKNLEIILVNDGSPDHSGDICDKYACLDSRIIVVHQDNLGGCEARNKGLDLATGEYIMFVDGDDWLADDAVEYLLSLAENTNSEIAVSVQNFTTRNLQQTLPPYEIGRWTPEDALTHFLYLRSSMGCWNKLYKRDLIINNNIRFDVPWYGEGMYFISMAISNAKAIAYGNKKVYYYRMNNANSAVTKYNVNNASNALWNIKNIKKKISVRTPRVIHCINWHIWLNNYLLLLHIAATGSIFSRFCLFLKVHFTLLFLMPNVIFHAEKSRTEKLLLLKKSILPLMYVKKEMAYAQLQLQNDINNWNLENNK